MPKRNWIFFAGGVAAAALFLWLWKGHDESSANKGVSVEALTIYRTGIFDSVESLGTTQANESIDITPTVTERISDIRFSDGQQVTRGDIIAVLEQDEELAQLEAAKARQLENQRELRRLQELLKNKAAAKRDYDERLTQIEVANREVEEVQARIEDRTLRAPFNGILGIRRLSVGALVQPGQLLTTLDDVSSIKLDFAVPSLFLSSVQPGVAIEAYSNALGNRAFKGEVASVNTRIDPVTRSVLVRALLPNDDGQLRPGLLMRVTLLRNEREGLVTAEESIVQRGREYYVFVIKDDGTVEQRQVTVGTRRPGLAEITQGLAEGEKVIVRGVNVVREGQKVNIAKLWDSIRAPQVDDASRDTHPPINDEEKAMKDDVAS